MGIRSKAFFALTFLLLITSTSCTQENATGSFPSATMHSSKKPATVAPTEVSTSLPTVPDTILLRIEFDTTSDWSDLTFSSLEHISGVKLISVEGDHIDYEIDPEKISISQPIASAEKGERVGVTFDLNLEPESIGNPQFVLLERGDLNTSIVKIYHVHNDDVYLLQEIIHNRMVLDQLGRNPHNFILDLSAILDQSDE